MSLNTKGENLGQINVVMKNKTDDARRGGRHREPAQAIREHPRRRGEVRPAVLLQPEDADRGRPLRRGPRRAARLLARARARPGASRASSTCARRSRPGNPELQVVFDRDQLAALGLDMGAMSSDAAEPRAGRRADALQGGGPADRHPHPQPGGGPRVARGRAQPRAARAERRTRSGWSRSPTCASTAGPAEIHRLQQQRAAVISANLGETQPGRRRRDVERVAGEDPPPPASRPSSAGRTARCRAPSRACASR